MIRSARLYNATIVACSVLACAAAHAQSVEIECSQGAFIGTPALTNPVIAYDSATNSTTIVMEEDVAGGGKKLVAINRGLDRRWGTSDDSKTDLMLRSGRPGQRDFGAIVTKDGLLFRRLIPAVNNRNQIVRYVSQIVKVQPGRDGLFGTRDDSPPTVIKSVLLRANMAQNRFYWGVKDDLVAWIYRAPSRTGSGQGYYVGGCDTTLPRGSPGGCGFRDIKRYLGGAPQIFGGISALLEVIPVRNFVGPQFGFGAIIKVQEANGGLAWRGLRVSNGTVFDSQLPNRSIISPLESPLFVTRNLLTNRFDITTLVSAPSQSPIVWSHSPLNVVSTVPFVPEGAPIVTAVGVRPVRFLVSPPNESPAYEERYPYTYKIQDEFGRFNFGYWLVSPPMSLSGPDIIMTIPPTNAMPERMLVNGDTVLSIFPAPLGVLAHRCPIVRH